LPPWRSWKRQQLRPGQPPHRPPGIYLMRTYAGPATPLFILGKAERLHRPLTSAPRAARASGLTREETSPHRRPQDQPTRLARPLLAAAYAARSGSLLNWRWPARRGPLPTVLRSLSGWKWRGLHGRQRHCAARPSTFFRYAPGWEARVQPGQPGTATLKDATSLKPFAMGDQTWRAPTYILGRWPAPTPTDAVCAISTP